MLSPGRPASRRMRSSSGVGRKVGAGGYRFRVIRHARPDDIADIVAMVHELADYERAADQCHLTIDDLQAALFGPAPALFGHVAVDDAERVVGFALWFRNFSTWRGRHGIYLEDLYVRPEARGGGHGTALLRELARTAVEQGYARVEWAVLDWNAPAIDFYRRLGAEAMDEWTGYRLTGEPLARLGRDAATGCGRPAKPS